VYSPPKGEHRSGWAGFEPNRSNPTKSEFNIQKTIPDHFTPLVHWVWVVLDAVKNGWTRVIKF